MARPAPPPRDPPGQRPSSKTGLYAGIGVGVLALVGIGLFAARKLGSGSPPVTVAEAPPPTTAPPPPPTAPPEALAEESPPPVEAEPEATPPPVAIPTPIAPTPAAATPPPAPTTTLKAAPSPTPAKKGAPTPAPAATPAGPSPEQLRAQQVAGLLGQAESALAAAQYDQAIGHLDEVLRLDPENSRATGERATAVSLRDAGRKTFVAGRTVVKTDKAAGGGLAGFEGAAVQKTPDFSGRIEFEMSPASGLKPGDAWTLKVYLVNDGKKAIKVGGVTASTVLNGAGAGGPVAPGSKEVAPQQRALVGTLNGSWREGTSSWVADVLVTANKGDTLKNTLTWR
jgi:outer membrane biosynthesis protein TonB